MALEPVPRATFDGALRRLDAAALSAFVVDLWEARGYVTRREEGRVVVERDGETRVIHVHDGTGRLGRTRRPPAPAAVDADLVVTNVATTGDGVLGATDLRDALLYAVPPSTGDALCRRHLGVPARRERTAPTRSGSRPVAVVALVVLVATAGLALAAGLPGGVESDTTTPGPGDDAGPASDASDPTVPDRLSPTDAEVAPGVARDGTIDTDRLVDAHTSVLATTSYTWVMTYREYRDGTRVSAVRWRVVVESPGRYNSTVTGGGANGSAGTVVGETAYADGTTRYVRGPDGRVTRERVDGSDRAPHVEAVARLIAWYLSVGDASVGQVGRADDGRHYVFAEGDPWTGTEEERTIAVVRDYGLVDSLHRRHRIAGTNTTVVLDFEYRDTGATTVVEPAWVTNATGRPDPTRP